MIAFEVKDNYGFIGAEKQLKLVSWNGKPAKLDLRKWNNTKDGLAPGKGITLTEDEARELVSVLENYFDGR